MKTTTAQIKKLHDLLKSFSTAMLVTHDALNELHARPMAIADLTDTCELWFISNQESAKVHEIEEQRRVHVVCQNEHSAYLSISGTAVLVHDSEKVAKTWKEPFRVWFPDGPKDAEIVLIQFVPDRAEFWDNLGFNKVSYLWEAARSYVMGETPDVKEGQQHGVVTLK